ncbi:2-keto-4-pentenoate hydratase [Alteribacter natronophilus]|uniref:2-keto-4-pentenoate hydratase n=1 Tax=Alteribacter natronophilus TaxID=2583810 RepID=UPI00110DF90E|nr:fumarylacetoacetate hydrolase family protein [Alteribacter natronophilus]TMW70606.1 4-oxalocrotonate decarboxylase [Alteribacter natronophilus]
MNLQEIARHIDYHQKNGIEMEKVTLNYPSLKVDDAYEIQKICIDEAGSRGERLVGWKMGLTSAAKQKMVGVNEAIYGRLTSVMEMDSPELSMKGLIHPKVEPELAFILKKDLKGDRVQPRDVWLATECIVPAVEVIDSRYKNFSFTLEDVVADNASSTKFLLGNQAFSPYHTEWDKLKVTISRNNELQHEGYGRDVLAHPVRSVAELVRMLSKEGIGLKEGMVILTGGVTEAVNVQEGDTIRVDYENLGTLDMTVTE